jgi:exodeoxyribonuclease-3
MRVTTWNINGMRAAIRKGLAQHIERIAPDVLLLQEVRARPDQLPSEWVQPDGWHVLWHPAEKLGYSGVAVLSRHPIKRLSVGLNGSDDPEGRLLLVKVGGLRLASVYLPSGSSSEERQAEKDKWLPLFDEWAAPKARSRIPTLLGGDFNIAHSERDIFHWRSNRETSGFLPHERKWIGDLFESGWRDFVREQWGDVDGPYTWWSNMGRARELDRGWRIDYILGNRAAAKLVKSVSIDREAGLAISDHAPVTVEVDV